MRTRDPLRYPAKLAALGTVGSSSSQVAADRNDLIRKRRRKARRALGRKKRDQLGVIIMGATIAAILAAGLPRSCNPPLPLYDEALRERIEDLAKEASARDQSGR